MTETAPGKSRFVYVTYIRSTPEKVWEALTEPAFTERYWFGIHHACDWKTGSPWAMKFADGRVADSGEVLEADPPRRLVLKWLHEMRPEGKAEGYARCEITLEPFEGAVKLSIDHSMERADSQVIQWVSAGWPRILANLKSLLETGELTFDPATPAAGRS